jgi:hypothetical protein
MVGVFITQPNLWYVLALYIVLTVYIGNPGSMHRRFSISRLAMVHLLPDSHVLPCHHSFTMHCVRPI